MTPGLLTHTSEFVTSLLYEQLPDWSLYHNLEHTQDVVEACEEIGKGSKLSRDDLELVLLAAWFHDTGYVRTREGHEEESVTIAREFLTTQGCPPERIEQVATCIRATAWSAKARTLPEMVIKDADVLHAGTKEFGTRSQLLRLEQEKILGKKYTDLEWMDVNLGFLARSEFLTDYARNEYGARRKKNLLQLHDRIQELTREKDARKKKSDRENVKAAAKKEKTARPDRGIETMFRTVPTHHLTLSSIADQKANIMLSSNALIVSIVFGLLISKLDTNPHLIIPTFLLLAVCLTAIVFAILSTRPKVTRGTFSRDDIQQKNVNLLFFGNFHSVPFEDFEWGMKEMMKDREYLYGSMIKDLYHLGQVLEKKYRYLRICYSVFMYGLIASVIAFLVTFLSMPGLTD
ncbi:MAG: DUF5706 domain-containing protein [Ignavibacteria bacterium]|nr:DUF5706 domain-containing protein [Ignavibacteria bacterium]